MEVRRGRTFWEPTRQLAALSIRRDRRLSLKDVRNEWATRRIGITGPTPSDLSTVFGARQQRLSSHSRLQPKAIRTGIRAKISPHPCRRPGGSFPPTGHPLAIFPVRGQERLENVVLDEFRSWRLPAMQH